MVQTMAAMLVFIVPTAILGTCILIVVFFKDPGVFFPSLGFFFGRQFGQIQVETNFLGRLSRQFKGDSQASQIQERLNVHVIGRTQNLENHVAVHIGHEIAVPFLRHALELQTLMN